MLEHYRHLGRKEAAAKMEQLKFTDPVANEQGRPGPEKLTCSSTLTPASATDAGNG
jgi:hypothetical protein